MAEEALVESLVADSVKLVEELDKQGDAPSNVLWYYFSDAEEWRLLIAGESFDQLLPRDESHFRDNTFNGIFVKEMLVMRAA